MVTDATSESGFNDEDFWKLVHDDALHAINNAKPGERFTVTRYAPDGSQDVWKWQEVGE